MTGVTGLESPSLGSRKKRGPADIRVICQPRAELLAKLVKAGVCGGVGCRAGAEGGRGVNPLMDDIGSSLGRSVIQNGFLWRT